MTHRKSLLLTVGYSRLEEQIEAGGFVRVDKRITSANFPVKDGGEVLHLQAELVGFGRCIDDDSAEKELGELGLRPGDAYEILAVKRQCPDIQGAAPVVALGSSIGIGAGRSVVCLFHDEEGEPTLDLEQCGGAWDERTLFLGFPV